MPMSSRILADAAQPQPPPPRPTPERDPPRPSPSPPPPSQADPLSESQPPEPAAADSPPASTSSPPPTSTPAPTPPDGLAPESKQRFDRLTREKYDAERKSGEWEQRFHESERLRQDEIRRAQGHTGPDPVSQAREQGRMDAANDQVIREFNNRCDALFAKGRQEYGAGMDDARTALNAVGYNQRPDAIAALIELPEGHRVYRALAADLDNAARILRLPPMGIAMEFARMAQSSATPTPASSSAPTPSPSPATDDLPVSDLPEPLRSVGGNSHRAPQALSDPKMPLAEFFKRRDKDERRSRISR